MRRAVFAGATLAALIAAFAIWWARREVPAPAETVAPAALAARAVDSTARPPAPPERTAHAAAPVAVERELPADNDARFKALHQAVVTTTPEAARLYSELAKAGVVAPPQARTLVEMKERGTPHDQLVAYVRASFPNDVIARAVALRWLDAGTRAAPSLDATPRSLGALVKRDAQ